MKCKLCAFFEFKLVWFEHLNLLNVLVSE